jgi:hypothetical protein
MPRYVGTWVLHASSSTGLHWQEEELRSGSLDDGGAREQCRP